MRHSLGSLRCTAVCTTVVGGACSLHHTWTSTRRLAAQLARSSRGVASGASAPREAWLNALAGRFRRSAR
jgi:hypothetical protein